MKHITFIGILDSTFASRWRETYAPGMIEKGRNLSKDIAKNKGKVTSKLREQIIDLKSIEKESTAITDLWDKLHRGNNLPGYNRKKNDTIYYVDQENRQEKIKKLSQKLKENPVNRDTPFDRPISKSAVKNPPPKETVINPSKKTSLPPNNPINSKSTTPLLKPKKLPLGKLGLGTLGLAATGAIGYGLYRKTRNDKGKKRGRYSR